ncbi:FhaA domain-containing protein [Mariniluteicoccus flavus]
MGFLDRFERGLEGAVNGVFARAFKGDVQPVEIAARLQKELDSEAKLMSRDRKLVPNEFVIGLSQTDYDRLTPYGKTLSGEIIPELRQHATSMGYVFNGPIMLHFELNAELPTGRFTVDSEAVAGVEANEPATRTTAHRAQMVVEVNGMRHPLVPPGVVIGRGSEADLRVNDPGISRRHAEIRVSGSAPNLTYEIVDLGSTNGITVDGQKVRQALLNSGSRIEIGNTRMLVHAPSGR